MNAVNGGRLAGRLALAARLAARALLRCAAIEGRVGWVPTSRGVAQRPFNVGCAALWREAPAHLAYSPAHPHLPFGSTLHCRPAVPYVRYIEAIFLTEMHMLLSTTKIHPHSLFFTIILNYSILSIQITVYFDFISIQTWLDFRACVCRRSVCKCLCGHLRMCNTIQKYLTKFTKNRSKFTKSNKIHHGSCFNGVII